MDKRRNFFDHHAETWDRDLQYEAKRLKLIEVVKAFELSPGDSLLDVGTGTGILLPFIKEAIGPRGILFAMDFSFRMLEQAKLRPGIEKNIINASVEAIPFQSDRFDRVTCFSAFPHFPNKLRALSEMVRVLRRGGKLFIAHLHSIEEINQLHKHIGGPVSNDFLPSPDEFRRLLIESGLDEVSIINEPGRFLARGKRV